MANVDYDKAARLLAGLFATAEEAFRKKKEPPAAASIRQAGGALFSSATQSYREVLLGCCLARILDASINIRHPYVSQGDDAFNGRTRDERVVNPFLPS